MNSPQINLSAGAVAVGLGVIVAALVIYKASNAVSEAGDYLASIPGRIGDTLSEAADSITKAGDDFMPQYVADNGGLWETNMKVVNSVNPASDTNLIYRGVNAIGGAVAGSNDWTLGGQIYDWTNPAPAPASTGGATGSWQ